MKRFQPVGVCPGARHPLSPHKIPGKPNLIALSRYSIQQNSLHFPGEIITEKQTPIHDGSLLEQNYQETIKARQDQIITALSCLQKQRLLANRLRDMYF
ncbi:hypothetical protein FDZ73_08775 [bacterium]|nr:MAG: hypothetical protein FDZ73_08775 [bacterium]